MKNPEPIPQPPSALEKAGNLVAILALLIHFALIAYYYDGLPERIPIHFGLDGKADGWGSKSSLWFVLVTSFAMLGLFQLLNKLPAKHINYPVKITPNNAQQQYQITRELMALLGAGINLLFLSINWGTIQTALGQINGLGVWFMLVVLIFVFGPIGYSLQQAHRYKE